jgi:glycosyltransferase involved in cell wall biosynthesis
MKLSLILPVFNGIATIERAISSYKGLLNFNDLDTTLYIIDNNSNDGTLDLVNDLISPNSKVHVICNDTNIGPGKGRNLALNRITEGFVGFLDADDEIIPDNYYKAFKEGFLSGADWITFNGWTEKNDVHSEKYDFNRIKDNTNMMIRKCLRGEFDGSVIFSMYSTDLIERLNLFFPDGYYEDIPFAYTAMVSSKKRHISNHFSYIKHNTAGSIVNSISKEHINGLLKACITIKYNFSKMDLGSVSLHESDFIFGAHGYLANLIRSIIQNNNIYQNKIGLLQHLIKSKKAIPELRDLPVKKDTKKELLSSYFIEQSETTNINYLFSKLIEKNKNIFR